MDVDEGSDQKSDIWPHWMAVHAGLKNEFTEDEKCHNLMILLTNIENYPQNYHQMNQLMRFWHFLSSVNSFFKRMHSHPVGLDV